jgi:hypothetical protein
VTSFSEQLETKQLPQDGKYDQDKRVDHRNRDQFVTAFLTNDGSAHGSVPLRYTLCSAGKHTAYALPMCLGCSMQRMM